MQAQERRRIESERDAAVSWAEVLQENVEELKSQKAVLESEIEDMLELKTVLINEMNELAATNESQKEKLNSLHYLVGDRKTLQKEGVIVVPVFARDRAGKNWRDDLFASSLDLRSEDTVEIHAKDAGMEAIGKLTVIPGSYTKDVHYSLNIAQDRRTATVKILEKDRFRNDKVVFALSE
jgi:FtsZ-binding cell division protein ZapB